MTYAYIWQHYWISDKSHYWKKNHMIPPVWEKETTWNLRQGNVSQTRSIYNIMLFILYLCWQLNCLEFALQEDSTSLLHACSFDSLHVIVLFAYILGMSNMMLYDWAYVCFYWNLWYNVVLPIWPYILVTAISLYIYYIYIHIYI